MGVEVAVESFGRALAASGFLDHRVADQHVIGLQADGQ